MRNPTMIKMTMENTGWAYYDMNWLSEREAYRENAWRKKKVAWLRSQLNSSFNNNKLHIGPLSPGCTLCGEGKWSCIFLTSRCPCACFFCPQKKYAVTPKPTADGISFSSSDDYAKFIEIFGYQGMSISGGDSLSDIGKATDYVGAIKKLLGKKIYTWAYTSGRTISEYKLKKLKQAGLDEIRFNIAAINYNTAPLKLATRWIDTVTVEIPAIPQDLHLVTSLLSKLKTIGVKHLNIHDLMTNQINYTAFVRRGYTFLHSPSIDVLESGNAALEILEYAVKNKILLPINYCSNLYRNRVQKTGSRRRWAMHGAHSYEEITEGGYIRCIVVYHRNFGKLLHFLRMKNIDKNLWYDCKQEEAIFIHPQLIEKIPLPRKLRCIYINYYKPSLSGERNLESEYEINISTSQRIFINRSLDKQAGPFCIEELRYFKSLYLNVKSTGTVRYKQQQNIPGNSLSSNMIKTLVDEFEVTPSRWDEVF